jgi:hypothetical protein
LAAFELPGRKLSEVTLLLRRKVGVKAAMDLKLYGWVYSYVVQP